MATVFKSGDKGPEIKKKLNELVGELEGGIVDVEQAVIDAQQSASDAEQSKIDAEGFKNQAESAATNAANDVRSELEDVRDETEGFRDETALIKADFETAFGGLSYLAPVEYGSGIEIDSAVKTVEYDGEVYAPLPSEVPFTTSGTFESDKFRLIQGVTTQQMASTAAGGFAANIGRNVIAVDSIADLLALPEGARRGDLRYLVRGYHAGTIVGGGNFYWDADSTAVANDGTVFAVSGVAVGRFIRFRNNEISILDFGAIGDGVADDTDAVRLALLFGRDAGVRPLVPGGTFMLRADAIHIDATANNQVIGLYGIGEASVLKIFDGEITSRWKRMFFLRHMNYENVVIEFNDLVVNHNASGSEPPVNAFDYEQSHTFNCSSGGAGSFRKVSFRNVIGIDPAADIFNNASPRCKLYEVIGCRARDRVRSRSDIQFSIFPEEVVISDFIGQRIETEPVSPTSVPFNATITDVVVDDLDYGLGPGQPEGSIVHMHNVTVKRWTYLTGVIYRISNSSFRIGTVFDMRWGNTRPGTKITDTKIYVPYNADTKTIHPLDARACNIHFDHCDFIIDHDNPVVDDPPSWTHGLIGDLQVQNAGDPEVVKILENCWFDSRAVASVYPYRNGTWILKNNDYAGSLAAIQYVGAVAPYTMKLEVDGGDFRRVTGLGMQLLNNTGGTISLTGEFIGQKALALGMASGSIANANCVSSRTVIVPKGTALYGGFKGDRVVIQSQDQGMPDSYIATSNGITSAAWKMQTQSGVLRDTTANRPTLTAADVGYQYIDTTLSAGGKPIWWTGTAWVDATGTVV